MCVLLAALRARLRGPLTPPLPPILNQQEDRHSGHFVPSGKAKPLPVGVLPLSVLVGVSGSKSLLSSTPLSPKPPPGPSPSASRAPLAFPGLSSPRANPLSNAAPPTSTVVVNPVAGLS